MDVKINLKARQANGYKLGIIILVTLQIFLLMNSPVAQSYEINKTNTIINEEIIKSQEENKIKGFLVSLFSIKEIGLASAISSFNTSYTTTNYAAGEFSLKDSGLSCCAKTNSGAICQDVATSNSKEFCDNALPTKCEKTSECKVGCCYDEEQGLCSTKSTKSTCEENNGKWADEKDCLIPECEKGCCVLGARIEFTTERRCEVLSLMQGRQKNFKDSLNELQCIALEKVQQEGACILAGNTCKFTTQSECAEQSGKFNAGTLCSNPSLNTTCTKQFSVNCVEGKDEIYWFDSCGNRENIYSSNKETSWNNGLILTKEKSCNPLINNIDSKSCGNCNYFSGSKCEKSLSGIKINDGNFVCKDMTCKDENGRTRENGESWCVYDGVIGNGTDVVGSRHWKRLCLEGKIVVEPCADYRGQICVQTELNANNKGTTQAQCVINDAISCIGYNQKENMKELCDDNKDCLIKNINIDDGFKFDMCVGQYPKGFDLTAGKSAESAKALCGMANQECVVMYEKKITGWECIFNCHCEDKKFTEQMNDLCISMGDCGAYVNIEGKGTNSYTLEENENKISWKDYIKNSEPVEGQYAEPRGLNELVSKVVGKSQAYDGSNNGTQFLSDLETAMTYVSTISGAIGTSVTALAGLGLFGGVGTYLGTSSLLVGSSTTTFVPGSTAAFYSSGGATLFPTTSTTAGGITTTTTTTNIGTTTTTTTPGLAGSGGQLSGVVGGTVQVLGSVGFAVGVGAVSAMLANWAFGLSGDAALVTTLSGIGAGLAVGIGASIATSSLAGTATGTSLGLTATSGAAGCMASLIFAAICAAIVVLVVVLVATLMKMLGIGETKEIHVKYNCLPWQAPFGASDCSKCNNDPLKPCSEYRCASLGKACGLLNKNSENPLCVAKESDDGLAPEIKIKEVSTGYKITKQSESEYQIRTEEDKCIPEFTSVLFKLETSEFAQCKFDMENKEDYDSMSNYLMEGNLFEKNHTGGYMMPSLSSLEVYNISGNIKEKFANTNIHIKCIDDYGNYNKKDFQLNFCLTSGPDSSAPYIIKANPINKAYIKRGVTELPFSIYLNEPAECRLDTMDRNYEIMQGQMECLTNLTSMTAFGWECKTKLTDLTKEKNTIYIKCKDQPWLEGSENITLNKTRNVNNESTAYTLYSSKSELKIDSISPEGNLDFSQLPASINLKVITSGGFDLLGKAKCQYSFNEGKELNDFYETYDSVHNQHFDFMESKEQSIFVSCKDDAGNQANKTASFKISLDNSPPQIVRINTATNGNEISLRSNEKAICYYSEENCEFNLENATVINSVLGYEHSFSSSEGIKYYIKCKDKWDNKNAYCAIIVSRSESI